MGHGAAIRYDAEAKGFEVSVWRDFGKDGWARASFGFTEGAFSDAWFGRPRDLGGKPGRKGPRGIDDWFERKGRAELVGLRITPTLLARAVRKATRGRGDREASIPVPTRNGGWGGARKGAGGRKPDAEALGRLDAVRASAVARCAESCSMAAYPAFEAEWEATWHRKAPKSLAEGFAEDVRLAQKGGKGL